MQDRIIPGARSISITAVNFKPIAVIRKAMSKKVTSFFKVVDSKDIGALAEFKEQKQKMDEKLKQQVKKSRISKEVLDGAKKVFSTKTTR